MTRFALAVSLSFYLTVEIAVGQGYRVGPMHVVPNDPYQNFSPKRKVGLQPPTQPPPHVVMAIQAAHQKVVPIFEPLDVLDFDPSNRPAAPDNDDSFFGYGTDEHADMDGVTVRRGDSLLSFRYAGSNGGSFVLQTAGDWARQTYLSGTVVTYHYDKFRKVQCFDSRKADGSHIIGEAPLLLDEVGQPIKAGKAFLVDKDKGWSYHLR